MARVVTERLRDSVRMHAWIKALVPVEQFIGKLNILSSLAIRIENDEQQRKDLLPSLVSKIIVSKVEVNIEISADELGKAIGVPDAYGAEPVSGDTPLRITIASHLLRCGRQIKIVIGNQGDRSAGPDPQLVAIMAKTRLWFEGLASGRYARLEDIALVENCD